MYTNVIYIGGIFMKKKLLSMAIIALLVSALAGCGNKNETSGENVGTVVPDANDNSAVVEQDTDDDNDQNTKNMISVDNLEKGKFMLTNENDGVSLVHNNGEYKNDTYYYYKDGTLQNIEVARTYDSKEAAQKAYDSLKDDEQAKKDYVSIDVQDNTIYMLSNQSAVDELKSLNQQQLYDKLKSEHPDAITNENADQQQNSNEQGQDNEIKNEG